MKTTTSSKSNILSMQALTWLSSVDYSNKSKYTPSQRESLMEAAAKMYPPTREESLMEQLDKLLNW